MKTFRVALVVGMLLNHGSPPAEAAAGMGYEEELFLSVIPPVITASKKPESIQEAPGVISVVTAEQIKRFGSRNLAEVLDKTASVYMIGSYLYPVAVASMRGDIQSHSDTHVLYLLNGRPIRESLFGGIQIALFKSFPVDAIDRVEIVRGPGSVLYGTNAYTGVVNVITKKGKDDPSVRASLAGGTYGTGLFNGSIGRSSGDVDFHAAVSYGRTTGWRFTARDEGFVPQAIPATTQSTDYSGVDVGGHASLNYKNLSLEAAYMDTRENVMGFLPLWGSDRMDQKKEFFSAGYEAPLLGDRMKAGLHVTYNGDNIYVNDFHLPIPDGGDFVRDSQDFHSELTLSWHPSDSLNVIAGGVNDHLSGNILPEGGQNLQARGLPAEFDDYRTDWWSSYIQGDWKPASTLKLVAGGQWNKAEGIPSVTLPRGGVILNFSPQWGSKLLYGEAFRAPYFAETRFPSTILNGNPDLQPEKIRTTDFQVFHQGVRHSESVTVFHSKQTNRITRITVAGPVGKFVNIGELTTRGVELEGSYSPARSLSLVGSYTYQSNQDQRAVKEVTSMPRQLGKVGVSYAHPAGVSASVFNTFVGERPEAARALSSFANYKKVNRSPFAYNWLSANLSFDLSKMVWGKDAGGLVLTLSGQNLLDAEVNDPEFNRRRLNSLPARPGSSFLGEVSVKF